MPKPNPYTVIARIGRGQSGIYRLHAWCPSGAVAFTAFHINREGKAGNGAKDPNSSRIYVDAVFAGHPELLDSDTMQAVTIPGVPSSR